jgi:hypothetical protein
MSTVKISSTRPLDIPVADWIKSLHADLDARIAAAEAKLASKPAKVATDAVVAPETPKKAPKAKKAPDAPKKEAKEPKTDVEVEKRIKRMSPTLTKQLTTVFQDAKKEFAKEKGAEFAKYVNELSKEAFEAKNLSDHMRDFAGVGAVPVAVAETKKAEPKKVVKKETPVPEAVPDEDLVEVPFKGVKYVVGEISKRVYEANDDGDKFVGLLGLGKFKTMQLPA